MQKSAVRLQSKTWTPRTIQSRVCERQTRVETEGFIRNNSVKYIDPDGRSSLDEIWRNVKGAVSDITKSVVSNIQVAAKNVYYNATEWHYEGREAKNTITETKGEIEIGVNGCRVEPRDVFHQGKNDHIHDTKYINPDGREVIFDGATGKKDTNSETRGTYNYVDPGMKPQEKYDVKGWLEYAGQGAGHLIMDVLPYLILGNDRPNE